MYFVCAHRVAMPSPGQVRHVARRLWALAYASFAQGILAVLFVTIFGLTFPAAEPQLHSAPGIVCHVLLSITCGVVGSVAVALAGECSDPLDSSSATATQSSSSAAAGTSNPSLASGEYSFFACVGWAF